MSHADTAGAAAYVAEKRDPTIAAISPPIAAELYGLEIVENNVEDSPDNMTRFVILAREPVDLATLAGEPAITTFIFAVKNVPAALYKAMGGFDRKSTRLNSRHSCAHRMTSSA